MADRPFAINGGAFGNAARSWVDSLHALEGQQAPEPTQEEILADFQRRAAQTPPLNQRPYGIHGGKFGEASRAFADATRDKVTEYGQNWQQGSDVLMDMIYRVLQRYR